MFSRKRRKPSLICSIVLRGSYNGHKERDGICLDGPLFHIFQTCMEENASRCGLVALVNILPCQATRTLTNTTDSASLFHFCFIFDLI